MGCAQQTSGWWEFRAEFLERLFAPENMANGYPKLNGDAPLRHKSKAEGPRETLSSMFLTELPAKNDMVSLAELPKHQQRRKASLDSQIKRLTIRPRATTRIEMALDERVRMLQKNPAAFEEFAREIRKLRRATAKMRPVALAPKPAFCQAKPGLAFRQFLERRREMREAVTRRKREIEEASGADQLQRWRAKHRRDAKRAVRRLEAKLAARWLRVVSSVVFVTVMWLRGPENPTVRDRHESIRASLTIQLMWRRKTAVARGRVFRENAMTVASWVVKRWRLKMKRKRRIAADVLREFLIAIKEGRLASKATKDFFRATRILQRFARDYVACTAARVRALTELWIDIENDRFRKEKAAINSIFDEQRQALLEVSGHDAGGHDGQPLADALSPSPPDGKKSAKVVKRPASLRRSTTMSRRERLTQNLDLIEVDYNTKIRELNRRKVLPATRYALLRNHLADLRREYKLRTPCPADLLPGEDPGAKSEATIDDVRAMLLENPTAARLSRASRSSIQDNKDRFSVGSDDAAGVVTTALVPASNLLDCVLTKLRPTGRRRRAWMPPAKYKFRLFAMVDRDIILDLICQAEARCLSEGVKEEDAAEEEQPPHSSSSARGPPPDATVATCFVSLNVDC